MKHRRGPLTGAGSPRSRNNEPQRPGPLPVAVEALRTGTKSRNTGGGCSTKRPYGEKDLPLMKWA